MNRRELYDLVWSKPVSRILKEYAISQAAFKNLCKENDIPLPPNGHWQKLKHHKKAIIIPLPIIDKVYSDTALPKRIDGKAILSSVSELNLLIDEIKNNKNLPLVVSEQLIKPDLLIKRAKEDLKKSKILRSHNLEGLYGTSNGIFNIYVSKALIKRALLFSNALIVLLKKRGHNVEVRTDEYITSNNGTKAIINGEVFEICVRESRKRVKIKSEHSSWTRTEYVPTGVLTFRIEELNKHQWEDSKTVKLEDKLPRILAYLELRALKDKNERISRALWLKNYEENKKNEEELKLIKENELVKFKKVVEDSRRWEKSVNLRNYIKAVEKNAIEKDTNTEGFRKWLLWINHKADWYDPLIEKDDMTFNDIDRNSI